MLARVVAAVCSLLSFGLSSAGAGPVSPSDRRVVVYLRTGPSTKPDDATVSFMKRELETLMETAGYRVEWKVLGDPSGKDDRVITVVELRGSCRAPEPTVYVKPVENGASLASTAVERGKILPFSWINCETLTEMLAPSLSGKESGQRDFLYGRAMGRLLAHELYHTLSNKRGHSESGVGKATFSANDVLAERFTFDRSVLAQSPAGGGAGGHGIVAIRP
jgi:hypothetical protein